MKSFGLKALNSLILVSSLTVGSAYADNFVNAYFYDLDDAFISNVDVALKEAAKHNNIILNINDAKKDADKQKEAIFSHDNSDPKIVNLVNVQDAKAVVDAAKKHNARVVFVNRQPDESVIKSYDKAWYVGSDAAASGKMQADLIARVLKEHPTFDKNKDGVINTILIKGQKEHQDTILRSSNVIDELAARKVNIKKIDEFYADFDKKKAVQLFTAALDRHPIHEIELVICNNDAMALGVIQALNDNGFNVGKNNISLIDYQVGNKFVNYIPVFGIDAIPEAIDAIAEDKMEGTILNDYTRLAEASLAIATEKDTSRQALTSKLKLKVSQDGFVDVPYKMLSRIHEENQ